MVDDEQAELRARALRELDVAEYFDLSRRETFFYRLLCLLCHRREKKFGRVVMREIDSHEEGALSEFARGRLLGILDGLYWSRSISEHMHVLLQTVIQERKDWSKPQ